LSKRGIVSKQTANKIFKPTAIVIVFILTVLTAITAIASYLSVYNESINSLRIQNYATVRELERWLAAKSIQVENNAFLMRNFNADIDMLVYHFGSQIESSADVSNVFVGFPDGRMIVGGVSGTSRAMSIGNQPWYVAASQRPGEVVFSRPYICAASDQLAFAAARTVANDDDSLGVIVLSLPFATMTDFFSQGPDGDQHLYSILDRDGRVLFHPDSDLADYNGMLFQNINEVNNRRYTQMFEAIRTDSIYTGNGIIYIGLLLEASEWYVITSIPLSRVINNTIPTIISLIIMFLFMLAVFVGMVFTLNRISKLSKAERDAEGRATLMMDAAPVSCFMIRIVDTDGAVGFEPIDFNGAALELFGFTSKDEVFERFYEIFPTPTDDVSPTEVILLHVTTAINHGYDRFEFTHRRLSGESIPCEITIVRTDYQNSQVLICFQSDLRPFIDILDKEKDAHILTQKFLDSAPFFVEIWDDNIHLINCNQSAVDAFGLGNKQEYIENFFELSPEYQPCGMLSKDKAYHVIETCFREGYIRLEWMHMTRDGEPFPVDVTYVHLKRNDESIAVGYSQDLRPIIAVMEEKHEAEENSYAKTQFLARMSHEIRTPMNSVLGITEIELQKNTHTHDAKKAFQRINNASTLLLTIINDILDLSKVEAGKMEIVPDVYEIASLIADTIQLNLMYVGSKKIEFTLKVDENLPTVLIGDELRIKQILNNIISNAFKYTMEGSVSLKFGIADKTTKDEVVLLISVSDTGQGMSQDQVEKLFGSEFTRFNIEQNRAIEGSGLGMTIAYSLVKMMNGNIVVESEQNKGSRFTVSIPQKIKNKMVLGKETSERLQNFESMVAFQKRHVLFERELMPYGRVLVVDDVESNLFVAKGILALYQIAVDTCNSGLQAIAKIKDGQIYDVILMDHMMPGIDGIEATMAIRNLGYSRPIIALTANATFGASHMFMSNGFSDFISKPIDVVKLDTCLMRYIHDKQPMAGATEAAHQTQDEWCIDEKISDELRQSFLIDANKGIAVLKSIAQMDAFDANIFRQYTICTHGLKSALTNIGQVELAKTAELLEDAGRNEDMETIKSQTSLFIVKLCEVAQSLSPHDGENTSVPNENTRNSDAHHFFAALTAIALACGEYDIIRMQNLMDELRKQTLSKQNFVLLDKIETQLLLGDYASITATIKQAVNEMNEKGEASND